jgi:hypothetical protein
MNYIKIFYMRIRLYPNQINGEIKGEKLFTHISTSGKNGPAINN